MRQKILLAISYMLTSARGLLNEPQSYGALRILAIFQRAFSLLKNELCFYNKAYEEVVDTIDHIQVLCMQNPDLFKSTVTDIVSNLNVTEHEQTELSFSYLLSGILLKASTSVDSKNTETAKTICGIANSFIEAIQTTCAIQLNIDDVIYELNSIQSAPQESDVLSDQLLQIIKKLVLEVKSDEQREYSKFDL